MRKGQTLCVLATLLITACGQSNGNVALKPTTTVRASGQSSAESTPQPSPSPTPARADLTCRLPVIFNPPTDKTDHGWVTFPGGQFSVDSASQWNGSYDWAIHAWVPVEAWGVAPDGKTYLTYTDITGAYSLVNARTGSRKVILSTKGPKAGQLWSMVAYTNEGVILGAFGRGSDTMGPPEPGIWLLDPASGHIRLLEGSHYWTPDPLARVTTIGGGFAWTIDQPNGSTGTAVEVYRLNLATGQTVAWYKTKVAIELLSATADGELLVAYGDESRPALLDRSHRLTQLDIPADFDSLASAWTVARPGVWITEPSGRLNLYVKGVGIHVIVPRPESPDSPGLLPAGDCR